MVTKPLVIGLTGAFGSGKTTAANFFEGKGFTKIVLSSFLREELVKLGKSPTRKNLQDIGNNLRQEKGPGYLAGMAFSLILDKNIEKAVVDGIRNIQEIEMLRKNANFVLIGIVADRSVRFERVSKMKGREELTREEFEYLDRRDLGLTEDSDSGLQVAKCLALSDFFVESNEEEVYPKKLEKILEKI